MQTLNLLSAKHSSIQYAQHQFSDGQPHLKIDTTTLIHSQACVIYTRLAQPSDLLLLLYAANALRYAGIERIAVAVSYLMAARMDRVMTYGEPFSLKVIASILNAAQFSRILVFDPHSTVSLAVLDNAFAIDNAKFVGDALVHYLDTQKEVTINQCCLVAPDAGALKKVYATAAKFNNMQVVTCSKQRNPEDGTLSGFKVFADNLNGMHCIITDDICDGGGTFIGIATELKKLGAEKVVLVVSHGIFSKGYQLLNVDAVYTTNSFKEFDALPENCTVFPVLEYLQSTEQLLV
jgi:ribose-phosphate pyrophosphokinase